MALNNVTLTGTLPGAGGALATFTPSGWLTDSADSLLIPPAPEAVHLSAAGSFSVSLLATDNGAPLPSGWAWTVTFSGIEGVASYSFSFFLAHASGATQDISELAPLSSVPTLLAYSPPGRPATLVVAASNASAAWKNSADYVCTGTADDVKINAALAALPAQGGTVVLSDGTFTISAPIIPTINASRLLGQGPDATTIQAAAGANCNGYQYDETKQSYDLIFCAIEGVTFEGNGGQSGGGNTSGYGCYINYSLATHTFWDFYLRDVWFRNWAQDGFYSTGGHGYVLDHVLCEYNSGNGVTFAGGFVDSPPRIVNGTFKINTGIGVSVSCVDALVQGNEISNCSGACGLMLAASGCKAIGNQIHANSGSGVHATNGAEGIELLGNTISSNAQHGLLLDDANCTVTGNFFLNNSDGNTGTYDEINVAHGTFSAAGNQIAGNIIDCASSSRYGINLAASGDTAATLVANRIIGAVTAATNFVPTDTVVLNPGVLAAGGAKITGLANGSASSDAAAFGQLPVADATAASILATGSQAAGGNGKWADSGHVHPAASWVPADNALLVGACPPEAAQGSAQLIGGTLYLVKWMIRAPVTITNLWWGAFSLGSGTSTGTFTGLYSSAGTLLSGSADVAASLNSGGTGPKSMALTTPQALTAGTFVWAALLTNLSSTQPQMWRSVSSAAIGNMNLSAASFRYANQNSIGTSLPSPLTPASNSQGAAFALCAWGS